MVEFSFAPPLSSTCGAPEPRPRYSGFVFAPSFRTRQTVCPILPIAVLFGWCNIFPPGQGVCFRRKAFPILATPLRVGWLVSVCVFVFWHTHTFAASSNRMIHCGPQSRASVVVDFLCIHFSTSPSFGSRCCGPFSALFRPTSNQYAPFPCPSPLRADWYNGKLISTRHCDAPKGRNDAFMPSR